MSLLQMLQMSELQPRCLSSAESMTTAQFGRRGRERSVRGKTEREQSGEKGCKSKMRLNVD